MPVAIDEVVADLLPPPPAPAAPAPAPEPSPERRLAAARALHDRLARRAARLRAD